MSSGSRRWSASGFYDGPIFHRVIPGFMAQGGDPKGTGEGGSELPDLKAEFNDLPLLRGTVGEARARQPDSANSQFFIMFAPNDARPQLYGGRPGHFGHGRCRRDRAGRAARRRRPRSSAPALGD